MQTEIIFDHEKGHGWWWVLTGRDGRTVLSSGNFDTQADAETDFLETAKGMAEVAKEIREYRGH